MRKDTTKGSGLLRRKQRGQPLILDKDDFQPIVPSVNPLNSLLSV